MFSIELGHYEAYGDSFLRPGEPVPFGDVIESVVKRKLPKAARGVEIPTPQGLPPSVHMFAFRR